MNDFFIGRTNDNILFSRYRAFLFLANPETSKSMTSSQTLLHIGSYTFDYLLRILGSIKMKFGQILLHFTTNMSNLFLAVLLILKTSSKAFYAFYDFEKIAICNLIIFNKCYVNFFNCLSAYLQKKKKKKKKPHTHKLIICF